MTDPLRFSEIFDQETNCFDFFNLVRLRRPRGLNWHFSETDTGQIRFAHISGFDKQVTKDNHEMLSIIVADVTGDPEELDITQMEFNELNEFSKRLEQYIQKKWGLKDFSWSPWRKSIFSNDIIGMVNQFTYYDKVKRFSFALRTSHKNKNLVVMYQLNDKEFFSFARELRETIENAEFL